MLAVSVGQSVSLSVCVSRGSTVYAAMQPNYCGLLLQYFLCLLICVYYCTLKSDISKKLENLWQAHNASAMPANYTRTNKITDSTT